MTRGPCRQLCFPRWSVRGPTHQRGLLGAPPPTPPGGAAASVVASASSPHLRPGRLAAPGAAQRLLSASTSRPGTGGLEGAEERRALSCASQRRHAYSNLTIPPTAAALCPMGASAAEAQAACNRRVLFTVATEAGELDLTAAHASGPDPAASAASRTISLAGIGAEIAAPTAPAAATGGRRRRSARRGN